MSYQVFNLLCRGPKGVSRKNRKWDTGNRKIVQGGSMGHRNPFISPWSNLTHDFSSVTKKYKNIFQGYCKVYYWLGLSNAFEGLEQSACLGPPKACPWPSKACQRAFLKPPKEIRGPGRSTDVRLAQGLQSPNQKKKLWKPARPRRGYIHNFPPFYRTSSTEATAKKQRRSGCHVFL